ncbi:heterokaryon incompatibility protein [Seiridium cupressi]
MMRPLTVPIRAVLAKHGNHARSPMRTFKTHRVNSLTLQRQGFHASKIIRFREDSENLERTLGWRNRFRQRSQGKTIIKVPWLLIFILYIVEQHAQWVYIGYYEEGYRWSRNSNIHFLSTGHDIEVSQDGPEKRKIKNENGYAPLTGSHEVRVLILYPGEKGSPIKLRRQDAERVLWVGAPCIDQTDNRGKKTQQVRIMGEIYSRANRVLIWLGNSRDVEVGMQKLLGLALETHTDWTPLEPVFTNPLYLRAQDLLIRLGFHGAADMIIAMLQEHQTSAKFDWDPLMPVVKSPWFTRVWVNERRGWFELQQIDHDDENHPSMRNFYILHDMYQKHKNKRRNKHTLLELLFLTRGFQATDPVTSSSRYSLFGRDEAIALSPELDALPSWVPDLRRPDLAAPLPKLPYLSSNYIDLRYELSKEFELRKTNFMEGVKVYHEDLKFPWWAVGHWGKFQPQEIAISDGASLVNVKDTRIGTIKALGTPLDRISTPRMNEFVRPLWRTYVWLSETWRLAMPSKGRTGYGELPSATFDAAWRTMICCMTSDGHNVNSTIYSRAARSGSKNSIAQERLLTTAKQVTDGGVVSVADKHFLESNPWQLPCS